MRNFLETAIRWYDKANATPDTYDKFISIWISFNAIYGQAHTKNGKEMQKIKTIVHELRDNSVNAVMELPEVNFFCQIDPPIRGNFFDTMEEQRELKNNRTRRPRFALCKLLYILNTIRNNLFHGSKNINHIRDVEIVSNAYPIVRKLVEEYLRIEKSEQTSEENSEVMIQKMQAIMERYESKNEEMKRQNNLIPKNRLHPISILLDHDDLGHALLVKNLPPQEVLRIQQKQIAKFETNKPEVLMELDEVLYFVKHRVGDVINKGCPKEEMDLLWEEYSSLVSKYKQRGYFVH